MREIIFRAWDGDKYHYGGFVVHPDGKMEYPEGGWDVHGCDDGDLLEQYTGLKDKNGKKIFEGDVIEFKNIDRQYVKGIVYYLGSCFLIESIVADEDDYNLGGVFSTAEGLIKVIGNIHDNPELLEGGTC